jgi:hypothetical protein
MDELYWPFPVLPVGQQTAQHRAEIQFLTVAHREGFRPYTFAGGSYGASAGERGGRIIVRTRSFREVRVGTGMSEALAAYVGPFEAAAEAVLWWLRGKSVPMILEMIGPHLVQRGGSPTGYRLGGYADDLVGDS